MNLKQLIKQKVNGKKYPKLFRIKLGKILMIIVALPLGTAFLFPLASAMMMPMFFPMWAKDKIREMKIKLWSLR